MGCGCGNKAKIRAAVERKFREAGRSTNVNVANVVEQIRKKRLARIAKMEEERKPLSIAQIASRLGR